MAPNPPKTTPARRQQPAKAAAADPTPDPQEQLPTDAETAPAVPEAKLPDDVEQQTSDEPEPVAEVDGEPLATTEDKPWSRERVLGPRGTELTGYQHFELVGALEGNEDLAFSDADLRKLVTEFRKRPVEGDSAPATDDASEEG